MPKNKYPFLLLALFLVLGCGGNSEPQPEAQRTRPPSDENALTTDEKPVEFEGLAFSIPTGWSVGSRSEHKLEMLFSSDASVNNKANIQIQVSGDAAAPAEILAEAFAESLRCSVAPDPLDFDGSPGFSVLLDPKLILKKYITIDQNDKVYQITAGGRGMEVEIEKAVSHVRETWKWKTQDAK